MNKLSVCIEHLELIINFKAPKYPIPEISFTIYISIYISPNWITIYHKLSFKFIKILIFINTTIFSYKMSCNLIKLALSLFQLVILGILLGPLLTEEWISQGDEVAWTGSLIHINKGSDIWEGQNYKEIAQDYCDLFTNGNYTSHDGTEAFCKTFRTLNGVGILFIIFSSFALLIWLGTTIALFILLVNGHNKCSSVCVTVLTPVISILHGLGYAIWMGNSRVDFIGTCEDLYDGDEPGKTCAEVGAEFGLFAAVFNICYAPVLVVVIVKKWYVTKETRARFPTRRIGVEMVSIETARPVLSQEGRPLSYSAVSTPRGTPCNAISPYETGTFKDIVIGYPVDKQ